MTCMPKNVKVILTANFQRKDLIKLIVQMSKNVKLGFLDIKESQMRNPVNSEIRMHWHPNSFDTTSAGAQFYEILDSKFYDENDQLNLQHVFGSSFKNALSQVTYIGEKSNITTKSEDVMLPPRVISFLKPYEKYHILQPNNDETNHLCEIQKVYYQIKKSL